KDSFTHSLSDLLYHHIHHTKTCYRRAPPVAVALARRQRTRELHDLCLANIVADTSRGFLSSPTQYVASLRDSYCYRTAARHDCGGNRFPRKTALPVHRLALVSRYARASDWLRSSWRTRPCRPLYLSPPCRSVSARSLEHC